ncbi:gliding motility-associated C-terminal domain-containing protein [Maribacter sp. MMG018]|uniref:Ig-like domain-containing protein n=1 Tax=Maribacter sp. MMG018 TaxID=2822688 RepID=UPI001B3684E7|nr:gliding motility-associated C-terminal domain-containing protein [Maribacter sp. MMG018]MBQ4914400.1 gliding motility-associated C-terminal domain-containing protein [Maribacter sp. MMG018]
MEKTYFQSSLLKFLVLIIFLGCFIGNSQTTVYAENIVGESNVDNSNLSIDSNLLTKAEIRANSGLVAGLGSYSGFLELQFPSTLPAFQTTYTKIETEDGLLTPLLGGSLGGLLSDVVGVVLIGNQEFNVQLKNGSTVVSEEDSGTVNSFSTDEVKVVMDKNEEYFIAASPSMPYNRIRITNRTGGSLLGLSSTKRLGFYDSFYVDTTNDCIGAEYTSFFGSGLTLDLLGLGGAGVDNPHLAIDDDLDTYSNIGLGVIGVAASIGQTFYLNRPSVAGEVFYLKVGVDPDLVQVGLLSNIQLSAKNGSSADVDNLSLSSLLDVDLLGLLGANGTVDIPFTPSSSIDRISLELSSLLNVSVSQGIQVYGVYNAPMLPVLDAGTENAATCPGTSASLIATVQNPSEEELRWYDAAEDGNLLVTLSSGEAYVTPNLTETTTYYVAAKNTNCPYESPRVAVRVTVIDPPTADDIDVALNTTCNAGEMQFVPSSSISGDFNWYLDANGTNQITDGLVSNGITYTVVGDGSLIIGGLTDSNVGYSVYASLEESMASCANVAGDLKEVEVTLEDNELNALITLNVLDSILDLIDVTDGIVSPSLSEMITVCAGSSIDLSASIGDSENNEIRLYDAAIGGNLLATLDSGEIFDTGSLAASTTYYLAVGREGCSLESSRVAINVNVVLSITADDIDVTGAEDSVCSSGDVVLIPSSDINGDFHWYLDGDALNEITDGLTIGDVTYNISESGILSVSGLAGGTSNNFYAAIETEGGTCVNAPGDLKDVVVSVVDSSLDALINLDTSLTIENLVDINNGDTVVTLEGSVSGDANEGDTVAIQVNGQEYTGVLDSNLDFAIDVDGLDILQDVDSIIEITLNGGICTITDLIPLPIPELPTDVVDYVFCALDDPTVADLELLVDNGVFFDALVGGSLLDVNASLVDGGSYFLGLLNIPIDILARVQINVDIIDVPMATTDSDFQSFCSDTDPVVGDIQVNEANVVFYDSATGGNILDPGVALTSGDYYVAQTMSSCESEDRLLITVEVLDGEPATLAGQIENACVDRSYTYNTDEGKTDYVWTVIGGTVIDGGQSTDDFVSVVWTSMEEASVAVSYSDAAACEASKENLLEVEVVRCGEILGEDFCLLVFNVFSPNGDGFNDYFEIQCIDNFIDNTVTIYNRNGNKVFETANYQNNWDGIANVGGVLNKGDHLPSGTYYYVIHLPELDRDVVGWLQLAR